MSGVNKVIYGNNTLIDLTEDTVSSNNLLLGETAHNASGDPITGSVITHDVIDNLTSTSTEDALSAKQGKVLNESKYGEGDTKVIFGSSNDVPDNSNIVIGTNNSLVTNDANKIIIGNDISFTDNYGNGNSNEEIAIGKGLISKLRTSENRLYLGYFNANDQTDYSKNEIIIGNGRSDSVRHDFIKMGQHGGNAGTDGYGNLTIDDVNLQISNASSRLSLGVANDVTQSSAWFLPIAIGADNTASGNDYPIAIGTNNVTDASRSITIGQHLNTTKANQVVVGKYNSDVNKPFIIGNGISDANRNNALEIDSSSNALFGGTITDGDGNVLSNKVDKTLVSDAWDNTKSYVIGDYCIYNNSLWKCLASNSNITPTEGTYWTSVSIAEQFGGLRFGFDGNGNYGYYKVGADTLTPFKSGSSEQEVVYNTGGSWQGDHTQTGTYTVIKKGVAIIMLGATCYSGGRTAVSSLTKNGVSINPSNTYSASSQMRRVYITEVEVGDVLSMSVTGRVDSGAYSGQYCWTSLCIVMV